MKDYKMLEGKINDIEVQLLYNNQNGKIIYLVDEEPFTSPEDFVKKIIEESDKEEQEEIMEILQEVQSQPSQEVVQDTVQVVESKSMECYRINNKVYLREDDKLVNFEDDNDSLKVIQRKGNEYTMINSVIFSLNTLEKVAMNLPVETREVVKEVLPEQLRESVVIATKSGTVDLKNLKNGKEIAEMMARGNEVYTPPVREALPPEAVNSSMVFNELGLNNMMQTSVNRTIID